MIYTNALKGEFIMIIIIIVVRESMENRGIMWMKEGEKVLSGRK